MSKDTVRDPVTEDALLSALLAIAAELKGIRSEIEGIRLCGVPV